MKSYYYLRLFSLLSTLLGISLTDHSSRKEIEESAARDFERFLLTTDDSYNEKTSRTESERVSQWEALQQQRRKDIVEMVNSTFQPLQNYFNYKRLTGYRNGEEIYHVGTTAEYLSKLIETLPDIGMVPKLTWLWKFIMRGEVRNSVFIFL